MKLTRHGLAFVALFTALVTLACNSQIEPIKGTPTTDTVLANAIRVARRLESYAATRTTVTKTLYPGDQGSAVSESRAIINIDVASKTAYRVLDRSLGYEFVRADGTDYTRPEAGSWQTTPVSEAHFESLPGEEWAVLPPAHPLEWLDRRLVIGMTLNGLAETRHRPAERAAYLLTGRIPMLPAAGSLSAASIRLPEDEVRIFIDRETFNVVRIEIDQNILDSLREDSGYQVIPGVVEIKTTEIIEYTNHNSDISVIPLRAS